MAIDPAVASLTALAAALVAILGQAVSYFVKSPQDGDGYRKQVEINTQSIQALESDVRECARTDTVRSIERNLREGERRLGTAEEQIKSNTLEILNIRPRLHQMANDLSRLLFSEDERRRRPKQ